MMKLSTTANFCRRLGIGLRAGVDILRVLETETKTGTAEHREVMKKVTQRIHDGDSLAKAMEASPGYFPKLLTQMVSASELGGRMDEMFHYMADYYDQLKQTRASFVSQISWPLIQLGMAIIIIGLVILLQGLLGTGSTYDASGVGLSGTSGFMVYCLVVGGTLAGILLVSYGLWKNWFNCHTVLVPLVQRIPVLGAAFVTLALSRLSMTLSMLLNAGVEAKRAARQAFLSTGNFYYISGMDRTLAAIDKGSSFGDSFDASKVLPEEFVEGVRVGELSGTETESLDRLAMQYQERAKSALNTIAMIASFTIWLGVMLLIAFMIIRMALQYINTLNSYLP
ncbi:MAG: type II secretion system F family protein [Aureliella sp.]